MVAKSKDKKRLRLRLTQSDDLRQPTNTLTNLFILFEEDIKYLFNFLILKKRQS